MTNDNTTAINTTADMLAAFREAKPEFDRIHSERHSPGTRKGVAPITTPAQEIFDTVINCG